jgi:hypothetical protein
MASWFRRSVLTGIAGGLSACAGSDEPLLPDTLEWLLGRWQGGVEGQQLAVTSVEWQRETALGAWSGEPVTIIVNGNKLSFVTPTGVSVQLTHVAEATMIGTVDRAPWQRPSSPLAYLSLQRVAPRAA